MKRILCLLWLILLLTGCAVQQVVPTDPTVPATEETEPPVPWVEEVGMPWDTTGQLREIPLTIPNGLNYYMSADFGGDLLLWSIDNHLADTWILELCLVELDDGTVTAQRDIAMNQAVHPQILEDTLYLCDSTGGTVYALDQQLNTVEVWQTEPSEGSWTMGAGNILYVYVYGEGAYTLDLDTGVRVSLLPDSPEISYLSVWENVVTAEYYREDTGAVETVLIDLLTGQILEPPMDARSVYSYRDGNWLFSRYVDQYYYYLGQADQALQWAGTGSDTLQFMDGETLLRVSEDSTSLTLYDFSGAPLAQCWISEQPYNLNCAAVIPNETLGGYFCLINNYEGSGSLRLLFWEPQVPTDAETIDFVPAPDESETEALLAARAQALSEKYGVSILVGEECRTTFLDFAADQISEMVAVSAALDTLDEAFSVYPEGFFRQLRYNSIKTIEIQLVASLRSTNTDEYTGTYSAFALVEADKHLVVVDIYNSSVDTYYHEFSHVIDAYLAWEAMEREGALFSEETWNSMNPGWFPGYTYDYSTEHQLEDFSSFISSYATISPTEDRAQILENAMGEFGGYAFEGSRVLRKKLDYYCRCIRDAFDTTGWPEQVIWEQYL